MLQSVGWGTRMLLSVCGNSSPEVASLHSDLPSRSPETERDLIKIYGLGSRIRDVEAFWYETEIKIIYFLQLRLIAMIVSNCIIYPNPKFLISKTKKKVHLFFWEWRLIYLSYLIMHSIFNKFIKVNFCVGCMVWQPNRL